MQKNFLVILFVVLAIAVAALFFVAKQAAKKKAAQAGGNGTAANPATTTGTTAATPTPAAAATTFPLKMGSKGKAVQLVQVILKLTPDGVWGNQTQQALQARLGITQLSATDYINLVLKPAFNSSLLPITYSSNNDYVKAVQIVLGVSPSNGNWGNLTNEAVQKATGLTKMDAMQWAKFIASQTGINPTILDSMFKGTANTAVNNLNAFGGVTR